MTKTNTYTPELREDGTYYLKTARVPNVQITGIPKDTNAEISINAAEYKKERDTQTVPTLEDNTEVAITVKSEDGEEKEYKLLLEKMSNDTGLKVISDKILKQDSLNIYVDEDLTEVNLTFETTNDLAKIKLAEEEEFVSKTITRTIDLTTSTEETGGALVYVEVQAEDRKLPKTPSKSYKNKKC